MASSYSVADGFIDSVTLQAQNRIAIIKHEIAKRFRASFPTLRSHKKKVKSGMGSPDCHVSMVDIHLRKILWVYCPGHAAVNGNDRADRLAGKATTTGGLCLGKI